MPYKLVEADGGWYVENEQTGKRKNLKPMPKSRAVKYMRALYAVEGSAEMKEISDQVLSAFKRNFDPNTGGGVDRDKLDASDFVDPERRRFPIVKPGDVMDAVHSYGRASPPIPFDKFKARVISIAKRKGAAFVAQLPKDWGVEEKEFMPALLVYKDATGADRWVTFSSNAYQDRDREIVSTAALEADVARADKEGNYGPLRWWHVGKPDPIAQTPGPGADIGTCDFNAMHGRVLVESGTFKNAKIAQAIKEAAPNLQVSIGYFHPRTEPDSAGVFNSIKRFERSLLPAGRASNPFTGLSVIQKSDGGTEMISEKIKAFAALLKDDELVQSILAQAEQKEKEAQDLQTAFKETGEETPETPVAPIELAEADVKAAPETATDVEDIEEPDEPVIGDMTPDAFAGMLAEAMSRAMEPYQEEVKALKASMTKKDDSEAALRESLELQAQSIQTLKSQLEELTGSQPRAATKGYRDSQSADTVVKDDSRVKGKQPTVDPDFIKMFIPGQ